MKLAGRIDAGNLSIQMASDTKLVARFNMPQAGNIAKGSICLDGLGTGGAPQVCRQVIYDVANNLVAVSDEVTVQGGQQAGWVDFPYSSYGGKLALPVGDFFAGLHAGAYANTIRVYGSTPHGMGAKWNADTYSDGASSTFGASNAITSDISCYLAYFTPVASLLPDETDLYYSRLPFAVAQAKLRAGASQNVARLVNVGWHDTFIDPEVGSVALVRDGSALTDLLGERVLVTTQGVALPRSVVAYVHNVADEDAFDWDLSLSRHSFAEIALLASDPVSAVVQVIG